MSNDLIVRGWMQEDERQFLKRLAFGKMVLELGSYEGLSTVSMAMVAKHVTTVDTFDGRATPEPKETLTTFVNHLNNTGLLHKVRILQGTTEEVLPQLAEEQAKYGLIFIDCDHSYEAVKRDIEMSLPLLADDGVIAFHDYDTEHMGVVQAVQELQDDGAVPIEQHNSLVAIKRRKQSVIAKQPVIYVAMPHRNLEVHLGAAAGLHFASNNKYRQVVGNFGTSVLTQCFNTLLCEALNARATDGVTHFAMLHNDVVPCKGWLDILMEEMLFNDFDMVSAVIPIKNSKGLTSTGIDTPGNPWSVRRLSMAEVFDMPETFTAKDIPFRQAESSLLLNTGCWVMKLTEPWAEGLCFRQQDCIAWSLSDQKYVAQSISEDWDLSRQLVGRGCRIAATRRVPIFHERPEFHNHEPWGEWSSDQTFLENERTTAEYVQR